MQLQSKQLLTLLTLVLVAMLGYAFWPRGYGDVGHQGYQYATALFSAVNQQDLERLQDIAQRIQQSQQNGELQPREAEWLLDIIRDAESGKWERANQHVRQLMEDQVREVSS